MMNVPFEEYIIVERVSSAPYIRRRGTSDHQKHNAIHRDGVTCRHDCKSYPCFYGIQNFKRNFAMKCKDFVKK